MAVTNEVGGVAQFYMGGTLMKLGASASMDLGGLIRKPEVGLGGVVGFTTTIDPPMIEVELYDSADTSVAAVRAFSVGTVQLALNNGKTYIIANAFQSGKLTVDTATGKYKAQFTGFTAREITAS